MSDVVYEAGPLGLVSSEYTSLCHPYSHTMAGKTLLAKTLAKVLDVPFSVSDATSFTQVSPTISPIDGFKKNGMIRQDVSLSSLSSAARITD